VLPRPLIDGSVELVGSYLSIFFGYKLIRCGVQEMFLEAPLDVLLSVHSYRTDFLVGMGNCYILVIANFFENPSLELS
jgi:hypothetical protein